MRRRNGCARWYGDYAGRAAGAAALAHQSVEEVRLGHVLIGEGEVGDRVLEQERRRKARTKRPYSGADHFEHFVVERQRHRHRGMALLAGRRAHLSEREMVAVPPEAVAPVPTGELLDVVVVVEFRASDRQAYAVGDERKAADRPIEELGPRIQFREAPRRARPAVGPEHVRHDGDIINQPRICFEQIRHDGIMKNAYAERVDRR
jgi:hypothetical protein